MEIKTTKEIVDDQFATKIDTNTLRIKRLPQPREDLLEYSQKKWVAVDDMIKGLQKIYDYMTDGEHDNYWCDYYADVLTNVDKQLRVLIETLSTSQSKETVSSKKDCSNVDCKLKEEGLCSGEFLKDIKCPILERSPS